jgi:AbrB family looped-hinge helix DNA binding protein
MSIAQVDSDGLIVLPDDIRDEFGLKPGDSFAVRVDEHHIVMIPVRKKRISGFRGDFKVDHALDSREEREIAWREQTRRHTSESPANRN